MDGTARALLWQAYLIGFSLAKITNRATHRVYKYEVGVSVAEEGGFSVIRKARRLVFPSPHVGHTRL